MGILLGTQGNPKVRPIPAAAIVDIPLVLRGNKRLESTRLEGKNNSPFSLPDSAIIETDADAPKRRRMMRTGPVAAPSAHPLINGHIVPEKQDDVAVA
ncbi:MULTISPECIES: hypothetical protein [unclassified Pseudodesulfovibrio]|uniref:hypothetical protein n=1 Tax=unclassified Pseudodesulfovibrio TaxID=2661612 RepID=UPI000FEBE5E5|nr:MULTISPECIES: hypothetical protein [unclassified Pseudodesulfovibrio]MCJ2164558.1 hypothetical protein [Pseudodesulfovibrio sp. S3-i]RWU04756.1 hypothetical protein DWB63_08380 [Pseudodesulfovibrio sp. S3]